MSAKILMVQPVIDPGVRDLCRIPYPRHPKGCPNYGRRETCPPHAPMYNRVYDLTKPVFAIVTEFNLAEHVERMRTKHPDWSYAQLSCLLYWQGTARKNLRAEIKTFLADHPGYVVEMCPEAMGVNVIATLKRVGIKLEWPPKIITRQVALAGIPMSKERRRQNEIRRTR